MTLVKPPIPNADVLIGSILAATKDGKLKWKNSKPGHAFECKHEGEKYSIHEFASGGAPSRLLRDELGREHTLSLEQWQEFTTAILGS